MNSWVLSGCDTELGVGVYDYKKLDWMTQRVCLRDYKRKKNRFDVWKATQLPPAVLL
jgi:hypothetical protein